jgi:hypothetical protein
MTPIGLLLIEMEAVALACEHLKTRLGCDDTEARQLLEELYKSGMPSTFKDDLSELRVLAMGEGRSNALPS